MFIRYFVGGADLAAALMSYVFYHFMGHILFGLWFDAVVPTNERMEKRIEDFDAQTQEAINKIRVGLRMNEPSTWGEGLRESMALFEDPNARATPEVVAHIAQLKKAIVGAPTAAQAEDLLFTVMRTPPLPGKVASWLKLTMSSLCVYLATRVGVLSDVFLFGPNVPWSLLMKLTAAGTAGFYLPLWLGTKAWRNAQTRKRHACEENLLSPEVRATVQRLRDRPQPSGSMGGGAQPAFAF